jgi:hypothetical protein
MYLLAYDMEGQALERGLPAELDQVVIMRWIFNVVGKKELLVNFYERETSGFTGGVEYVTSTPAVKPKHSLEWTVGEINRIAPVKKGTMKVEHVAFGSTLSFTLGGEKLPGTFIDPDSGEIFGAPGSDSVDRVFEVVLFAVDESGSSFRLETISIAVKPPTLFRPAYGDVRVDSGKTFTDPSKLSNDYYVGRSYKVARLMLHLGRTIVSQGTVADIKYTLRGAPETFFVQAESGTVFGTFTAPDTYVFELLAIDKGGQTAVAEELSFTVQAPPKLKLVVEKNRTKRGGKFTDYTDGKVWLVHRTYRIAPFTIDTIWTKVTLGRIADITYTLEGAPADWFVNADNGEIYGLFDEAKSYDFELIAIDAAGSRATAERFTFQVQEAPRFSLAVSKDGNRTRSGDLFTNPNETPLYTVGKHYRIAPPLLDFRKTKPSDGQLADIKYTLEGAPDGWFVNGDNGEITGMFDTAGLFAMTLMARDSAGEEATVEELDFNAQMKAAFATSSHWDPATMGEMSALKFVNASHLDLPVYEQNQPFEIPGPQLSLEELFVSPYAGDYKSIAFSTRCYSLALDSDDTTTTNPDNGNFIACPGKFFVSKVGELLISPRGEGRYGAELIAYDGEGAPAVVKTWKFTVLPNDVNVADYGPNNQSCVTGAPYDMVPFDGRYSCVCGDETGYTGDNCEVAPVLKQKGGGGSTDSGGAVGAVLGVLIVGLVCGVVVFKYRAHVQSMKAHDFASQLKKMLEEGELDAGQVNVNELAVPREIRRSHIHLVDKIGAGQFGEVWKAILNEGDADFMVAVKTVLNNNNEASKELLCEAAVMVQAGKHPNLVSIIGVVTRGEPLMLLVSMCEHGSLLDVLRKQEREGSPLELEVKQRMAIEIASGMAHLSANGFVHRDLAARNVLVATGLTCKVADFGLSRGTGVPKVDTEGGAADDAESSYYRSQSGIFPVRWTAPEAMESLKFSVSSDVWSFGIVVIEMLQNADKPYVGMTNSEVISKTMAGYRIPRPLDCPQPLYDIVLSCWRPDADQRPTFATLVKQITRLAAGDDDSPGSNPETSVSHPDYLTCAAAGRKSETVHDVTEPARMGAAERGCVGERGDGQALVIAAKAQGGGEGIDDGEGEGAYAAPVKLAVPELGSRLSLRRSGHVQGDVLPDGLPEGLPGGYASGVVPGADATCGSVDGTAAHGEEADDCKPERLYSEPVQLAVPDPMSRSATVDVKPAVLHVARAAAGTSLAHAGVLIDGDGDVGGRPARARSDSADPAFYNDDPAFYNDEANTWEGIQVESVYSEPVPLLQPDPSSRAATLETQILASPTLVDRVAEMPLVGEGTMHPQLPAPAAGALEARTRAVRKKPVPAPVPTQSAPAPMAKAVEVLKPAVPRPTPKKKAAVPTPQPTGEARKCVDTGPEGGGGCGGGSSGVVFPTGLSSNVAFDAMWDAAKPQGGCITSQQASAILKKSGLVDAKLKDVWNKAKAGGKLTALMNKNELRTACALVVAAGGSPMYGLHTDTTSV